MNRSAPFQNILLRSPLIVLTCIVLLFTPSCENRKQEQKEIKAVWKNYTEAVGNAMGAESVRYIDSPTINYYAYILGLVKTADSLTVEGLRFDQKILVLSIRHITPAGKIMQMTGRSFFAYCIQNHLCGGNANDEYSLKILSVKDGVAMTQLIDSNKHPGLKVKFIKEDGNWKINLTSTLASVGEMGWKELIKESGKTERELLYLFIEKMNDTPPNNEIWHPLHT